jgi:uncharacterized SAM-dependent methyltransferase
MITEDGLETMLYESLMEHRMADYFLYVGDEGAKNWLRLDVSKEFPVARRLTALLRESVSALLPFIPPNPCVVSIGSGNGEKERILLEELLARGQPSYVSVDVSSRMVDVSLDTVRHLPIHATGIVGFYEDIRIWSKYWRYPVLICVLGNTFCNFDPGFFFETVRHTMGDRDLLLFDCHLLSDYGGIGVMRKKIDKTYRSRRNVLFNLDPLLRRGMHPDDVEFRLELLPVQTAAGIAYRTWKTVYIKNQCGVSCGKNAVFFRAGDIIQLGFTYKYTPDQVESLANRYGFSIIALHKSADGENELMLARRKDWNEG